MGTVAPEETEFGTFDCHFLGLCSAEGLQMVQQMLLPHVTCCCGCSCVQNVTRSYHKGLISSVIPAAAFLVGWREADGGGRTLCGDD